MTSNIQMLVRSSIPLGYKAAYMIVYGSTLIFQVGSYTTVRSVVVVAIGQFYSVRSGGTQLYIIIVI